ncbi:MAG: hypothetical protein ACI3Z7_00680 [Candidatus Aphodosoma sp.]
MEVTVGKLYENSQNLYTAGFDGGFAAYLSGLCTGTFSELSLSDCINSAFVCCRNKERCALTCRWSMVLPSDNLEIPNFDTISASRIVSFTTAEA